MSEELSEALKNLRDILQKESHPHCIGVEISINSEGYELNYKTRTPGSLKRDGVSMQNLRGEWVK